MDDERISAFVSDDYQRVVGAVTLVCGDRHRAEDAVQEALARAWASRSRIESLAPWVTRVALNEVRSRYRRLGAEQRAFERRLALADHRHAGRADDERLVDARVQQAMARLTPRQLTVVVLHYFLDQSVEGVAATLGVHVGTVKTSLHRARASLRAALEVEEVCHD